MSQDGQLRWPSWLIGYEILGATGVSPGQPRPEALRAAPTPPEDEVVQWLARSLRHFARVERLGQRGGVAREADHQHCRRRVVSGDGERAAGLLGVEAAQLMHAQPERGRLNRKVGDGLSQVIQRIGVRRARRAELLRDGEHQQRGVLRPDPVGLDEGAEQPGEGVRIFSGGDDKAPGLDVAARGGPARGLKQAEQLIGRHGRGREGARAPARLEQRVDGVVGHG